MPPFLPFVLSAFYVAIDGFVRASLPFLDGELPRAGRLCYDR